MRRPSEMPTLIYNSICTYDLRSGTISSMIGIYRIYCSVLILRENRLLLVKSVSVKFLKATAVSSTPNDFWIDENGKLTIL